MDLIIYGNTLRSWSVAVGAALGVWLVLWAARRVVGARLAALATRTRMAADDLVVALVRGTRNWFLILLAMRAGSEALVLGAGPARLLRLVTVAGVVMQGALWGNLLIKHMLQRRLQREGTSDSVSAGTMGAIAFVARLVLWSFLVLLGLDNLGVDITALVAGLGVGGVAVALAVQNILGDLFASLSIVFDKPFEPGDFIIVGELMGTVEHVGLKTTRVRSLHGEQIIFSNADLLGSRIRNFKRMAERRVVFSLGVTYDTARPKLAIIPELVRAAVEMQPAVRFDRAHFKSFGAFSLDFEVVFYVLDSEGSNLPSRPRRCISIGR